MSDNRVLIEVKGLCKSFGDNEVLKNLSTEIRQGYHRSLRLREIDLSAVFESAGGSHRRDG